jgi:hypothetical protein
MSERDKHWKVNESKRKAQQERRKRQWDVETAEEKLVRLSKK